MKIIISTFETYGHLNLPLPYQDRVMYEGPCICSNYSSSKSMDCICFNIRSSLPSINLAELLGKFEILARLSNNLSFSNSFVAFEIIQSKKQNPLMAKKHRNTISDIGNMHPASSILNQTPPASSSQSVGGDVKIINIKPAMSEGMPTNRDRNCRGGVFC